MLAEIWSDEEVKITDCYKFKDNIKEIQGRRYEPKCKAWFVPLCKENVALLQILGAKLDNELKNIIGNNKIKNNDEKPIMNMPIRADPYLHQIKAFNFAIKIFNLGGGANDIQQGK